MRIIKTMYNSYFVNKNLGGIYVFGFSAADTIKFGGSDSADSLKYVALPSNMVFLFLSALQMNTKPFVCSAFVNDVPITQDELLQALAERTSIFSFCSVSSNHTLDLLKLIEKKLKQFSVFSNVVYRFNYGLYSDQDQYQDKWIEGLLFSYTLHNKSILSFYFVRVINK